MYYRKVYYDGIRDCEGEILQSCSKDIRTIVELFFDEICGITYRTKVNNSKIDYVISKITETAYNLARSTVPGEKLDEQEKRFIKLTFIELKSLYVETINNINDNNSNYYINRIRCIREMLCKNNGERLFSEYKNLYKIINLVNSNYDELIKRGFPIKTYNNFIDVLSTNQADEVSKTDEEKMALFKGILNGTMKFYPQYELKAIGIKLFH
jgi:hypothetical protein